MKRIFAIGAVLALWVVVQAALWPKTPAAPDMSRPRPAEVLTGAFPGPEQFVDSHYPEDAGEVVRVWLPGEERMAWLLIPDGMDAGAMRKGNLGLWFEYGYEVSYYRVYTLAQPYGVERVINPVR